MMGGVMKMVERNPKNLRTNFEERLGLHTDTWLKESIII